MHINSEYNKLIQKAENKKLDNGVQEQLQDNEQVMSTTDKNASSAVSVIGKSLVQQSFRPAQTKEELLVQVQNTSWLESKYLYGRSTGILNSLPKEFIVALSEVLHKADALSPELKKCFDFQNIVSSCDDFEKQKKLKNLREFSPEIYNKLDKSIQKDFSQLSSLIVNCPLQDVDGLNECYRLAKDEYKFDILSYLSFNCQNAEHSKRYLEIIKAINAANPQIIKLATLDKIIRSDVPASQIAGVLDLLSKMKNNDKCNFSKIYIQKIIDENYSYSLAQQDNEPICGTDKFKPFTTKEQLKTELASMRNKNGEWMFSNKQIEHIINNENDIGELSKILNAILVHKIEFTSHAINGILTREGVTYDIIKPLIDFYVEIQSSDEYENAKCIVNSRLDSFFKLKEDEFEQFKKNIPLLDVLHENFETSYADDMVWGSTQLFGILKNSKMSSDILSQILAEDIFPEEINFSQVAQLLKTQDVFPENIKFVQDLKNIPQLAFLFDTNSEQSLSNYSVISLLSKRLPENFDLSQKKELIAFLSDLQLNPTTNRLLGSFASGINYVDILTKDLEDDVESGRKLAQFIISHQLNNCNSNKYFSTHSFEDTYRLLKDFSVNPLLSKAYSEIYSYDVDMLDDLVNVADYALISNMFNGAQIDVRSILKSYFLDDLKIKMNTEKIKSNIDSACLLTEKMSDKLWDAIKSKLLTTILSGENIDVKEENIEYVDALVNDSRFDIYFDFYATDVIGLLKKDLNIDMLKTKKEDFFEFVKKYYDDDNFEIFNSTFISFDGDYNKLISTLENIRKHYPEEKIDVGFFNGEIVITINNDSHLSFDKNLNFLSKMKSHTFYKEDGTSYTGKISNDRSLAVKNYIISVSDSVYRQPRIEKLTSRYIGENGEISKTKVYKSSALDGVFDIREIAPNGEVKVISSSSVENGIEKIEKHLTSPSGVTSDVMYENFDGNEKYEYVIKSSNGEILTRLLRTSEKIDETTKITTVNDRQYKVQYLDNKIDVYDFANEKTTSIDLTELNPAKDPVIQELLRSLSGDELIKTAEFIKKIELTNRIDSSIHPVTKTMYVGPHKFVFEHELGHGKDAVFADIDAIQNGDMSSIKTSKISDDKMLNEIFAREKKIARETVPDCILDEISYFIADKENHYNGEKGGLMEVIAETNAIQTTAKFHPFLKMRTQVLQEYFPETIAYLLNNHLN